MEITFTMLMHICIYVYIVYHGEGASSFGIFSALRILRSEQLAMREFEMDDAFLSSLPSHYGYGRTCCNGYFDHSFSNTVNVE